MSKTFIAPFRSRTFVARADTMCGELIRPLRHYEGESKTYYADLGEQIKGRTITGVTSITSDDGTMTVGSLAVLSADTDDYDGDGNAITIEANTGVSFTMSGGTAGDGYEDYTATVTVVFSTSTNTEKAKVFVKVE